jgi:hypothetical protein
MTLMKAWKLGYEKAKQKAKAIYVAIGNVQCGAFDGEFVYFTGVGFNHLMRKGRIPRTRNEQKKRFVLIPYVKKIIQNSRTVIEYRQTTETIKINRHGKKTIVSSKAEFWTFDEKVNDCIVKVVIRQLGTGGPKHFFSVMGDHVAINKRISRNKKSRR